MQLSKTLYQVQDMNIDLYRACVTRSRNMEDGKCCGFEAASRHGYCANLSKNGGWEVLRLRSR